MAVGGDRRTVEAKPRTRWRGCDDDYEQRRGPPDAGDAAMRSAQAAAQSSAAAADMLSPSNANSLAQFFLMAILSYDAIIFVLFSLSFSIMFCQRVMAERTEEINPWFSKRLCDSQESLIITGLYFQFFFGSLNIEHIGLFLCPLIWPAIHCLSEIDENRLALKIVVTIVVGASDEFWARTIGPTNLTEVDLIPTIVYVP
ncbi:hypothetical protein Scep_004478 [Stephania cephalantha]|uniref:Uncharacterized protein n=1 Tax=Stephania cephalantha TaxID=152367 RepID=A0AAP0KVE1_9MAGN